MNITELVEGTGVIRLGGRIHHFIVGESEKAVERSCDTCKHESADAFTDPCWTCGSNVNWEPK